MKQASRFQLQAGWNVIISDIGQNSTEVARLAGLPEDLFQRSDATLTAQEYFNLFSALETLAGVNDLPLKLGQVISVESFDAAVFACLCSPNLKTAMQRLALYKRLIGPMLLSQTSFDNFIEYQVECYGYDGALPVSIAAVEVVFFVKLARIATRRELVPLAVTLPSLPSGIEEYSEFIGVVPKLGQGVSIRFSMEDLERPFLTQNLKMWTYFEPELQQRLSLLDKEASMAAKVRGVLLELLPSGESTIENVLSRLALSKRSLQRKLSEEGITFKAVLQKTRQDLARHYLRDERLSLAEISFLLGFTDANSFVRAFSDWEGISPGKVRKNNSR
ncbi:AraC family transcriptional regulator ligand-binding domain-containing protein [Reinekea marina]|uniref:AraC family transcriptional regulator ligand-binding domain-containing protein n=1 Tax=Reinekea marina TaxID=1310421 RepID=A0ABV7WTG8_9GAMM|nr:AraC family transcriptional regulator [Reinekea marina]MDN3649102.1 AraC family transcriptional regulator ligand-binding domain-containing protein [Reinekea marina]